MTNATLIVPGMQVKVHDKGELPNEWVWFTVTGVKGNRVNLLSPSGIKTWAYAKDIFVLS